MSSPRLLPSAPAVVRVPLPWKLAPEHAALLVREDARPFAFVGRWAGGGALVGSEPVRVAADDEDPFALLDQQPDVERGPDADVAVGGGWFGWLGYELGRRLEPVGASPPVAGGDGRDPGARAPFRLAYYDHVLRQDADGQWWFEALATPAREPALRERLRALRGRAAQAPEPRHFATEPWRATPSRAGHALAVAACRARIRAGDLFQGNVCVRMESTLRGEAVDVFAAALACMRPDRAAFVSDPAGAIVSLSPELFLERHGRAVRSAPIKGTRPRPADPDQAAAQRAALEASPKDRAENVMIVDLVRNDLGRVCVPGSIQVEALAQARAHAGVWHLVSEVAGVVREGVGDGALVRAAFPPGSVTGAPKVAAMNVIAELESTQRELYTGAVGFASPLAGLELSVAIRTFEFEGERAWLGVGGGIVADSDPVAEAAECTTKVAPLLAAIGATAAPEAAPNHRHPTPPTPRRLAPIPVPRPDPAAGVFETLLVLDGEPVALERHLARLAASVRALYVAALPDCLERELIRAALGHDRARLRVDAVPGDGGIRTHFELTPPPARATQVELIPITVPGGIGPHKWADRRLLHRHTAWARELAAGAATEPLLCDLDGNVLEASRANVFIVEDGTRVVTPPPDGRILPGVTRADVLELAHGLALDVRVERIDLERVERADAVFLTGSLSGVEPARLAGRDAGNARLVAELADAWSRQVGLVAPVVYRGAERLPA